MHPYKEEEGEHLVRSVKVFDSEGTLLIAAALVRVDPGSEHHRADDETGEVHADAPSYDIWCGDSLHPR